MGRFGLEFEAASESRKYEQDGTNFSGRKCESVLLLGRGSYGLTDRVEVTARLGAADLEGHAAGAGGQKLSSNYRFAWGAGVGGILYDAGNWNLAAQGNYFSHTGHEIDNVASSKIKYWDYNLGLQVQGKFDQFLPYVGVKYSNARADYSNVTVGATNNYKDEAEDNIGVYCGAGVEFAPQWSGYIEGRFVDETSFGGGIRYTF